MVSTITQTPVIQKKDWNRSVRCDYCPAAAHVWAWKEDERLLELMFCLHHGNKFLISLIDQGFNVEHEPMAEQKELAKLTEK